MSLILIIIVIVVSMTQYLFPCLTPPILSCLTPPTLLLLQVNGPNLPSHSAGLWGGGATGLELGVGLRSLCLDSGGSRLLWPLDLWPSRTLEPSPGETLLFLRLCQTGIKKATQKQEERRVGVGGRVVIGLRRRLFTDVLFFFSLSRSFLPPVSYAALFSPRFSSGEIPRRHGGGGGSVMITAAVSVVKNKIDPTKQK